MLASKDIVHKLIPQGHPMIMVDTLIEHNEHLTKTGFHISSDNLFVSNGKLSGEGLLENMAQSAALRTGWVASKRQQEQLAFKPPVGVIGAVKNFKVHKLPACNAEITTEIILQAEFMNASMIAGRVMLGNEILAEGELKIFLQDK
jgi:predicted hotdog family 3-hydroxylacyl-ACP dehydratase